MMRGKVTASHCGEPGGQDDLGAGASHRRLPPHPHVARGDPSETEPGGPHFCDGPSWAL